MSITKPKLHQEYTISALSHKVTIECINLCSNDCCCMTRICESQMLCICHRNDCWMTGTNRQQFEFHSKSETYWQQMKAMTIVLVFVVFFLLSLSVCISVNFTITSIETTRPGLYYIVWGISIDYAIRHISPPRQIHIL